MILCSLIVASSHSYLSSIFPLGLQSRSEARFFPDTSPKSIDRESVGESVHEPVPVRLSPRPSRSINPWQVVSRED